MYDLGFTETKDVGTQQLSAWPLAMATATTTELMQKGEGKGRGRARVD